MNPILRSAFSDRNRAALLAIMILFVNLFANGQSVYNPSNSGYFTPSNKPYAVATGFPGFGQMMKLDSINRLFRPFNGVNEVYSYFPVGSQFRNGNYIIIVDSGGTLQSNGTYIGGSNTFYMWKDSTSNAGLIKMNLFGAGGCSGCLLAANNLSDLANVATARTNLGLGGMAVLSTTAGGDLSGAYPNPTVARFNGQLPSYYLNYANLTNTPPLVSLTTTGSSGVATYNSGTGVLNIPNYSGSGGSCLNCNADTIGNITLNFTSFCNNCVLTLDSAAGYAYWAPSTGGIATLPPNSGSGFRIYSPQVPAFKSIICASGCTLDSTSNTGSLTLNITSGGTGTVTAFTAGNLSPIFTTSVANGTTTPALSFILTNAPAYNVLMNNTASPAAPVYAAPTSTILNLWEGATIATVPSAGLVYSNGTALADATVLAPLIYSLGNLSADTATGSQNLATQGWVTRNTANTVSNSDGTLTISPTSGTVIASLNLSHANTWLTTQTFDAIHFGADNTYPVGTSSAAASSVYTYSVNSNGNLNLNIPTSDQYIFNVNNASVATLTSTLLTVPSLTATGAVEFTGLTSGGITDSVVTWNPSNGKLGVTARTFSLFAVEGTSPAGSDSIQFGGSLGAFYKPDTLYTQYQGLYIYNLNDKSTLGAGDSVLILDAAKQMRLVPSSAIGGSGAVSSVADNGTGTTVISPTTGSVLVGVNASAFPVSFVPAVNNSVNIGSSSKNWENLYVNNIISPGALAFEVPTGSAYQFNINGTTNMGLLTTGQLQLQNYTTTSSFTGTAVGVLEFTSSGAIITAGLPSGAVSSVSDNGGGTLTISPTTGSVLAGINLANSNTWTATNNSFKNILPSATTTYSLGSTGTYWNNVYTNNLDVNNILPPSNLLIQLATGQSMQTAINGVTKEELLSTGQKQLNGYGSGTFTGTPTFALNVDATGHLIEGAVGGGGGVNIDVVTTITSGSSSTVPNGTNIIYFNPASTIASYTLTLPTTWHNSNNLIIAFSPTAFTSGTVVTTLTIVNGSGQTLAQSVVPTTATWGEPIIYHLIGTLDQRIE